jgi:hypothetical protein
LKASWQRYRLHFLRNALAYANMGQRQMVFALINTISAHPQSLVSASRPVKCRFIGSMAVLPCKFESNRAVSVGSNTVQDS